MNTLKNIFLSGLFMSAVIAAPLFGEGVAVIGDNLKVVTSQGVPSDTIGSGQFGAAARSRVEDFRDSRWSTDPRSPAEDRGAWFGY